MSEDRFQHIKETVLLHIQDLFEEMEEELALSHQEKYALLEDMFENASDEHELKVAFDRWFVDHAEDIGLDYESDELWEHALGGGVDYDSYTKDDSSELVDVVEDKKEDDEDRETEAEL